MIKHFSHLIVLQLIFWSSYSTAKSFSLHAIHHNRHLKSLDKVVDSRSNANLMPVPKGRVSLIQSGADVKSKSDSALQIRPIRSLDCPELLLEGSGGKNMGWVIPGIMHIVKSIGKHFRNLHGSHTDEDVREGSSSTAHEIQWLCHQVTGNSLPTAFCRSLAKNYQERFSGTNIFSAAFAPMSLAKHVAHEVHNLDHLKETIQFAQRLLDEVYQAMPQDPSGASSPFPELVASNLKDKCVKLLAEIPDIESNDCICNGVEVMYQTGFAGEESIYDERGNPKCSFASTVINLLLLHWYKPEPLIDHIHTFLIGAQKELLSRGEHVYSVATTSFEDTMVEDTLFNQCELLRSNRVTISVCKNIAGLYHRKDYQGVDIFLPTVIDVYAQDIYDFILQEQVGFIFTPPPTAPPPPPPSAGPVEKPVDACRKYGFNRLLQLLNGDPQVCAISYDKSGLCPGKANYSVAEAKCQQFGAGSRLCTERELTNNEAMGTGCQLDQERVWAFDECTNTGEKTRGTRTRGTDLKNAITRAGATSGEERNPATCLSKSQKHYFRCCARSTLKEKDQIPALTPQKTCEELGWKSGMGSPEICAESRFLPHRRCVNKSVSFQIAQTLCAHVGARLCTSEELRHDEARDTGCDCDTRMVWSGTERGCQEGMVKAEWGSSLQDPTYARCMPKSAKLPVRCCQSTQAHQQKVQRQFHILE